MTLKNTIESLAQDFAVGVLAAIRSASLQDILAETGAKNGQLSFNVGSAKGAKGASSGKGNGKGARVTAPVGKGKSGGDTISAITSLLSSTPAGLRAEQIRTHLKLDKPTVTKALTQALATGSVKKQGQKRATTYFAK